MLIVTNLSNDRGPHRAIQIGLSILAWLYAFSSSAFLFGIAFLMWLVTAPFDRRRLMLHRLGSLWAYHYIQIIPGWRCTISGRALVSDRDTVIYTANHQSMVDILAIFGVKKHFKWVSKQSVFVVPFIGWNALLNDYVGIRRGSATAMEHMLRDCGRQLANGSSVFFFPEGTRSRDGSLLPFKAGPFRLAVETNTPVVPVVIEGTRHILEKESWMLPVWKRVNITVELMAPVLPSAAGGDADALRKMVHDQIARRLGDTDSDAAEVV